MPLTEAQKKATKKYLSTLKSISVRVSEEDYNRYKAHTDNKKISLRAFLIQAIEEKIKRDSD
jgi:predicted DNA binding CopG/RHH family protein